MYASKTLRVLIAALLVLSGAIFVLLAIAGTVGDLTTNLGISMMVAGIVSIFHTVVLQRSESNEIAEQVAKKVHDYFRDNPLGVTGVRLVSSVRKGLDRYYEWAISTGHQELFFAGRSVLHRIDRDFRQRAIGTAERVITRRLCEGASIRILLVDPRSDLVPRLAREEGQTVEDLLANVGTSLGILSRLHEGLSRKQFPASTHLDVRVYDEVPYFAYHRVDDELIIGFYFSSALGHSSAAYELIDSQTKDFFSSHFTALFDRARDRSVLMLDSAHSQAVILNDVLLGELRKHLDSVLGEQRVQDLMSRGAEH